MDTTTTATNVIAKPKKRTEWDRRYDRHKRLIERINSELFYWCKFNCEHFRQWIERKSDFCKLDDYKRLGGYFNAFVDGYIEALQDKREREDFISLARWTQKPNDVASGWTEWMDTKTEKAWVNENDRSWAEPLRQSGRFWKHVWPEVAAPWYYANGGSPTELLTEIVP